MGLVLLRLLEEMNTSGRSQDADALKAKIEGLRSELHKETNKTRAYEAAMADEEAKLNKTQHAVADVNSTLSKVRAEIQEAKRNAAQTEARLKAAQEADRKVGPVGKLISGLPHQELLASMIGILGLLSVFG